ncbi:MAG: transketolase [Phototrophicales bacterium]|nr:MAG: transketolase [Phototrophicales bacterium]
MAYELIKLSYQSKTPHLGSGLSCIHLLAYIYACQLRNNHRCHDRFILSKGHAAAALYVVLNHYGYISDELLNSFSQEGSILEEHPGVHAPEAVECVSGSLGHNLSVALGMAYADQIAGVESRYFVLLGDGELNEGQVWEAAQHAPVLGLGRLYVVVDCNKWQGTGRSQEITALEPLVDRWRSFGWEVQRVDGHDIEKIHQAMSTLHEQQNRPKVIIADTVKGWGVSFMADDNNWHYRIPTEEEVQRAANELKISTESW